MDWACKIRWVYLQNADTDLSFFHYQSSDAEIKSLWIKLWDPQSWCSNHLLALSDSVPQIWSPATPMEFDLYALVSFYIGRGEIFSSTATFPSCSWKALKYKVCWSEILSWNRWHLILLGISLWGICKFGNDQIEYLNVNVVYQASSMSCF